jgi:mono/diheme cytochrome c family protein
MDMRRQANFQGKGNLHVKISISLLSRVVAVAGAVTLAAGAGLIGSSITHAQSAAPAAPAATDEYTTIVKPIFDGHCMPCHSDAHARGGLSLETPAGVMKGGRGGVVVVAGHPEQSMLIALIRHEGPASDPMPMPPPPHDKLSDADIAAVTKWVQDGAMIPQ